MNKVLLSCVKQTEHLDGDIIDFRVGPADVFIKLIKSTVKSSKHVWGITNYNGLGKPTIDDMDSNNSCIYSEKKFTSSKRDLVLKLQSNVRLMSAKFTIIERDVLSDSLDQIPDTVQFSLAYINLYQYEPTLAALNFLASRLQENGLVILDNYKSHKNILSNKAIKQFLVDNKSFCTTSEIEPDILVIKKIESESPPIFEIISKEITINETSNPVNIACVLKTGGPVYDYRYVNALANAVAKNITIPYTFTCLTDNPDKFNSNVHQVVKLKHNFQKWWSKIELFRPNVFTGQVFFLDLDTIIVDNIDEIVSYNGNFCGLRDFYKIISLGSGLLSWNPNNYVHVYNNFLSKATYVMNNTPEGDQKWIDSQVPKMDFFQDLYGNKIVSWKKDCFKNKIVTIPPESKIICFHGVPKPHEIQHPSIKNNWNP